MPVVEQDNEPQRFDLQTAPPDGFVVVRPLSYEEMLKRRDSSARTVMRSDGDGRKAPREATIEQLQEATRHYEFAHQIIEHNLLDKSNNLINFRDPKSFRKLPYKVASEIEQILDDLNEEPDLEGFKKPSDDGFTNTNLETPALVD